MKDDQSLDATTPVASDFYELSDSQLAFVGGGIGDVVGHQSHSTRLNELQREKATREMDLIQCELGSVGVKVSDVVDVQPVYENQKLLIEDLNGKVRRSGD